MPATYGMPRPAITVGDMIESLKALPPDAPIALVEVQQEWSYLDAPAVTTLTLKVWGGFSIPGEQKRITQRQERLPSQPARLT